MKSSTLYRRIQLAHNSYFEDGVLFHGWNYGFFSCMTTCLWELVVLYADYKIIPNRIDFSHAFKDFKTELQIANQADTYPLLFKDLLISKKLRTHVLLKHHTLYSPYDIRKLSVLVSRYFTPTDSILALQKELICKYDINVANTLVVCMRGTDKAREINNATPECYYQKCSSILKNKPGFRIWVQTDQEQYRDFFLKKFPGQSFAIEELPVAKNHIALHLDRALEFDRFKFSQYLLAAINLTSRCDTVITHTGNVGYWQALYRGNLNNFYQDTTHFYGYNNHKCICQFNCLPIRHKIIDHIRRFAILRKAKKLKIIAVLKKRLDKVCE